MVSIGGFFFVVLGLMGIALPNSIIYFSTSHLPSSVVAVVVNTVPIFTFILALFARTERFGWQRCLAVMLCVLGLLTLVGLPSVLPQSIWLMIVLLAPLCFASAAVVTDRFRPAGLRSQQLAVGMLWVAWLGVLPMALLTRQFYWPQHPWHLRDAVIGTEILLSSLGYVVFFRLLKVAGAVYYSLVGGVVAIMGVLWGWLWLHEKFTVTSLLGIALIIASVLLVQLPRRHNK